jgi:ketosteroid isomerase-like protein
MLDRVDRSPHEHAERAYDALSRRDLDAFLAEVDEDVEFRSLIAEAEGEVFHGHDGVRRWWTQVAGALGGLTFNVEDIAEHGDHLIARVRVQGTVGGTSIEQVMWQAVASADELAIWWGTFRSEDEALAALRERVERRLG